MQLFSADAINASSAESTNANPSTLLVLANDADPRQVSLDGILRIDLHFPKFTDGRAYSQAYLLRRRLGFQGEIRATGDVLIDQLQLMQRSGFDSAVLRTAQELAIASAHPEFFPAFYQGDAVTSAPVFARTATTTNTGAST